MRKGHAVDRFIECKKEAGDSNVKSMDDNRYLGNSYHNSYRCDTGIRREDESKAAQLEQLIYTADSVIDNVDRLVIKWQGEGKGDAQAQAVLLASHLGLEPPVRVRQTGHDVYRSEEIVDTAMEV